MVKVGDIYAIGPHTDLLDHWIQNNGRTITVVCRFGMCTMYHERACSIIYIYRLVQLSIY